MLTPPRPRLEQFRAELRHQTRHTREYLGNRALARRARTRLAEGPLLVACEAMRILNRRAKHALSRSRVYALKARLIEHLYAEYLCTVTRQVQVQACWGSRSESCGPDCWKCGGTGVYRSTNLLLFAFDFGPGCSYRWHQLEERVTYPVHVADAPVTPYEGEPREITPFEGEQDTDELLAVVREYLRAEGVELDRSLYPRNSRLGEALAADAHALWWTFVAGPVWHRAQPLRWWWAGMRDRWAARRAPAMELAGDPYPDDDDLPF